MRSRSNLGRVLHALTCVATGSVALLGLPVNGGRLPPGAAPQSAPIGDKVLAVAAVHAARRFGLVVGFLWWE